MPDALPADHTRPAHTRKIDRARRLARPLGVLIGLVLLFPGATIDAPIVSAGGSCTGWQSRVVPPSSIRVLRNNGRVEKVNFRRYVAVVMGSGEWPNWMPQAALEAGAVAVKQFAWYHTLAGHHRRSYVTARGQCYDVRDGTADQIYRPERAHIGSRQQHAIDTTWATSLRRNGNFILTQYRSGNRNPCGSDSDGRKLFQKSVMDCARRGWSANRIHAKYYGPGLTLVRAGARELALSAGPETAAVSEPQMLSPETVPAPSAPSAPTVALAAGQVVDAAPASVAWNAGASTQADVQFELQRLVDGAWRNVALPTPATSSLDTTLRTDQPNQFRVRAISAAGAASDWADGQVVSARAVDDRSTKIAWRGNWQRVRGPSSSNGTVTYTGLAGSSATFRFTGRALALVGERGPGLGEAVVYVDGVEIARVDMYAASPEAGVVFFAQNWDELATRTIRLEVRGTNDRGRIDLDSILTLR